MDAEAALGRRASERILEDRAAGAGAVVELEFSRNPGLSQRYGAHARERSLEDASYHLAFLAQALDVGSDALFCDYVAWVKIVLGTRGVSWEHLGDNLSCIATVLAARLPAEESALAGRLIATALARLPHSPAAVASFIDDRGPSADLARRYLAFLLDGDRPGAAGAIGAAIAKGASRQALYLDVFAATQMEIGRLWQMNRISVAQEHFCTAATQVIMAQAWPAPCSRASASTTVVATCVAGDLHEIGLRMVADLLDMAGCRTLYLGANTPAGDVVHATVAAGAQVLALSATLGFNLRAVEDLVLRLRADDRASQVHVLVGGGAFNADPSLWKRVGADGYAGDAVAAVQEVVNMRPRAP